MNSLEILKMEYIKQSLVTKLKKQWKGLQDASLETPNSALPIKFCTSLYANVKEASMMHIDILR